MRYFQSCYYSKLLGLNSQFRNILDQIESELELSLCRYSAVLHCVRRSPHLQVPQDAGVACAGVVAVILVDAKDLAGSTQGFAILVGRVEAHIY